MTRRTFALVVVLGLVPTTPAFGQTWVSLGGGAREDVNNWSSNPL